MTKKKKIIALSIYFGLIIILLVASFFVPGSNSEESIQEIMQDAVLHGVNKVSLFGLIDVNPALISSYVVTIFILLLALIIRIFVIPKFKYIPGKFQMLIEQAVSFFDNLASSNSPHHNRFLGAYIFSAGCYIFIGTLFELLGIQVVTINGTSISLPAPLSDINACIMLGFLSYIIILIGGIRANKGKGVLKTLKEFSLPISMTFRLFGALLSGLLVSELVYYFRGLSYVVPVIVGVLFTILHAIIQTYVLTMLTSVYYGEVSEVVIKEKKLSEV